MSNLQRNKEWRCALDRLIAETGTGLEEIAEYIDVPYNGRESSFYARLPQKRSKFIGIGMALGQPLEVINEWILKYSGKRRLYIKDISEDLIWIYLIGLNRKSFEDRCGAGANAEPVPNYYSMHDECQNAAYVAYCQLWDEVILDSLDTSDLEVKFEDIVYDGRFDGLKEFIMDNMDSFKTAYTKPRRMLDAYVDCILKGLAAEGVEEDERGADGSAKKASTYRLNSLRGFLDDSMINYLSGSSETHHVMDRLQGVRSLSIKHIPQSRKTHISMCLALGMSCEEINEYLKLMGFTPLGQGITEQILSEELELWEKSHPLQRALKNMCVDCGSEDTGAGAVLNNSEMRAAAESMLQLRLDLREAFSNRKMQFPYYNEKRKSGQ